MKKSLLFVLAAGIVVSVSAQNRTTKYVVNMRESYNQAAKAEKSGASINAGDFVQPQRKTPLVITNTAVSDIGLGNAGNGFGGYSSGCRSIVYADPNLNTVVVTHRAGPACTPSDGAAGTGCYMFDYSKDG